MGFNRVLFFALPVAFAIIAYIFSKPPAEQYTPVESRKWPGKNNTVLFVSTEAKGLSNALLATSHALLVEHSDLDVHYVSWKKLEKDIAAISKFAALHSKTARSINFHELITAPGFLNSLGEMETTFENAITAPGTAGVTKAIDLMEKYWITWTVPEYVRLYKEISEVLEEVDPAIVVAEPFMSPAFEAIREQGRNYAIITPNSLFAVFGDVQPWGSVFWKYPASCSGYPYPLPWHLIPANTFIILRWIKSMIFPDSAETSAKRAELKEAGIANPVQFFNMYNKDYLFITQSSPELEFPMMDLPENVVPCGPIILSSATAAEESPEIALWLKNAPTVLINLGSRFSFTEGDAMEMAKAVKTLLDNTTVQVLWKFVKRREFSDAWKDILTTEIENKRLIITDWIEADTAALLETGDIVAFVHHGGASCFSEAIASGVPHVVIPMWLDLYNYATRAEYLGVGLRANHKSAPYFNAEELSNTFLRVIGDGDEAVAMRKRANELSQPSKKEPGRSIAAREIAKLAIIPSNQSSQV